MKKRDKAWQTKLILAGILLAAFWLRVYKLEDFPSGLHFDEAANAILSSEIAFDQYRPIFISSYTGKETFFFYAAGLIMNRIGVSVFALRLTAAFLGLLTLAVTYRLALNLFKKEQTALIAALLLGSNFAHLLFSRLGFRAISQPLLQALTVLFLLEGMRRLHTGKGANVIFIGAGLSLGLTAHTYLAARLFPIALAIPLLIFAWLWFKDGKIWAETRQLGGHLLLMGGVALLTLSPLLYWFVIHPEAFWVRIEQVGSSAEGISTWQGITRAFSMLFFVGDPYIRFNLPQLAVFASSLMIFPAVQGVILAWQERGPKITEVWLGKIIIVIAPLIMLLPSALATSEIVPSNLRAIGIFPFIVLPIAHGLGWILDFLREVNAQRKTLQTVIVALIVLHLFGRSLLQPVLYFRDWGPSEAAFLETEGDVQAMAEFIDMFETEQPIVVSTRFVPHPTLAFLVDRYEQIALIPNSNTLVYPAGEAPLYFFPASSPENDWLASLAGKRETHLTPKGLEAFSTFSPAGEFPSPQYLAKDNFGFAVAQLGYDLEPGKRGETVTLRTYYRVLGNPGFNMVPFVHLEDHLGNRWSQLEQPGYSPADWQPGDLFVQQFDVPIPADLPPTDQYALRTGWFDGDTGKEVSRFVANGRFAGAAFLIEGVEVLYTNSTVEKVGEQVTTPEIVPGLIYVAAEFDNSRSYFPGDQIDFKHHWEATGEQTPAELITTISSGEQVIELARTQPAGDSYPFDQWQTPITLLDQQRVQIPADIGPGGWLFQTIYEGANGEKIDLISAEITIDPLDLTFEPPAVANIIDANFADEVRLVGYTLETETGELKLIWQSLGKAQGDYTAFVHLQNGDGTCCAWQLDRAPVSSANRPTSRWLEGEYLIDTYQIEAEIGDLPLWVGLYRPENGIRLLIDGTGADQIRLR